MGLSRARGQDQCHQAVSGSLGGARGTDVGGIMGIVGRAVSGAGVCVERVACRGLVGMPGDTSLIWMDL